MKKLSVLMLLGSLTACAAQATTTLSFSADFKIALPPSVRCLAYVVKHHTTEYILTVHANGISKTEFTDLVKAGLQ